MSKKLAKVISILLACMLVITACGNSSNTSSNNNQSASGGSSGSQSQNSGSGSSSDEWTEKSPEEYVGEITLWAWGDYEAALIPHFNKVYPNIKVNVEVVPSSDYVVKLQTTMASGGQMPDIALLELTPRGALMALDEWEVLNAAPYNVNPDDILDYALPLITNPKGEIVGIQEDSTMGGLAYKRNLAREYFGTDDPDEIEAMFSTWDDFLVKGREVYEKSGGKVTLFSGLYEEVFRLIAGSYTEPWVKDGKLNIESTFKPVYETLQTFVENHVVGNLDTWSAPWNASFSNDNVIFYVTPTWFVPHGIKANDKNGEGNYGLIKAPVSYEWGGTALAIPKRAKNKELAWQFIRWMTLSMDGARAFADVNNTMTLYKPAMEQEGFYSAPDPYFGGQDIMAKYIEIGKETQARPITQYDSTIFDANAIVLKMIETGTSAEEAYNKLVEAVLEKAPELK